MHNLRRGLVLIAGALACGGPGRDAASALNMGHEAGARSRVQTTLAALPAAPAVVREEAALRVGATPEHWALVWRRPPSPACGPDDVDGANTCPCSGFAYGEQGELDLVRRRPGHQDERLALTPAFGEGENPAWKDHLAVVRRWPVLESDYGRSDSVDLAPAIRARPVARVMAFGDYDHDGRATEFPLQVGTLPCGKHQTVLVGVSAADSSLHVFASAAHPERPLVVDAHLWELLRRSHARATGIEWRCGDHGSESQTEVSLLAGPSGIDGTRSEYQCTTAGAKGRLLSTERI